MRKVLLSLSVLLLLAIPVIIFANGANFFLAEGEEYNANIYWAGEQLIIDGDVNGDVIAAGNSIIINGNVNGDVLAAAENVRITGTIDGNIRIAAKKITIDGNVKRAVTIAGESIYLNDKSNIGATALMFARQIESRGNISGNLDGAVESLFISGKLTHTNIKVDKLTISDTAEIRGNLNYESVIEAEIGEKAVIGGNINYIETKVKDYSRYDNAGYFVGRFIKLLSLFLLGLVLLSLVKRPTILVIKKMKEDPVKATLWGLTSFIVIPVLALALAITVIGLPIAIILVAAYIALLYIAHIYSALLIGRWTASKLSLKLTWPWALLLGLFILIVLVSLPFIGGLFFFIAIWWGLGGVMQVKKEYLLPKKE